MTIQDSLFFNFNGVNCRDMGVINVTMNSGMNEEPFTPNRKINEVSIRGRNEPYFMGTSYEPLEIPLTLAFEKGFTEESLQELAEWITTEDYAPLIFENKQNYIYYAMIHSEGTLTHNHANQGYVNIKVRMDSPFAWTPVFHHSYEFSNNPTIGTTIEYVNVGSISVKPLIQVEVLSGNKFAIQNTSNSGQTFGIENLIVGEKLIIDFDYGAIETNQIGINRYKDKISNCKFFSLVKGSNYLKITGNIKIKITYQGQIRG